MKKRKILGVLVVVSLTVLFAGVISNWVAAEGCENDTARWLTSGFQEAPIVHITEWTARTDPSSLFSTNTVVVRARKPKKDKSDAPELVVWRAKIFVPFFVRVDWAWATGSLRGAEGGCWYLCLGKSRRKLDCPVSGSY